jgi:hypothetical protein
MFCKDVTSVSKENTCQKTQMNTSHRVIRTYTLKEIKNNPGT